MWIEMGKLMSISPKYPGTSVGMLFHLHEALVSEIADVRAEGEFTDGILRQLAQSDASRHTKGVVPRVGGDWTML